MSTPRPVERLQAGVSRLCAAAVSLPGKLLALSAGFVLLAEILIFFPSVANYRTSWLTDRIEAAHLAALAAESAETVDLAEEKVRELLSSANAIAVSRVHDGMNELILGGETPPGPVIMADLTRESWIESLIQACHTFFAPEGRYLRIVAAPQSRPNERINVLTPEADLRTDMIAYAANIFQLSLFIALLTGVLLYLALLFMFVRPMRRLVNAIHEFQADPSSPASTIAPSRRRDEIGDVETAFADMQSAVRDAFRQRERLAALGAAMARINHDLRNVLASAQLVSDRLATSEDERVAGMGARLLRAVDRGVRLCEDTLNYGRSEERAPELQPVALNPALDDAASDAFAACGEAEWINTAAQDMTVLADPDHLHRIFLNLMRNAVQAMTAGPARRLSAAASESGEHVLVTVRDTGPGVPDRIRETLFEPFGRTGSKGGSGLGLSIARELARAMGGDVRLLETGPEGSVFEISLKSVRTGASTHRPARSREGEGAGRSEPHGPGGLGGL
jgi:signal transduction histidine kinase